MEAVKRISQRELAQRWKCSQPYVAKLVKRGMPMTSEEAAAKWRDAQSRRGAVGGRTKSAGSTPVEPYSSGRSDLDTAPSSTGAVAAGFDLDGEHGTGLVAEVMQLRATVEMFRREIASARDLNSRTQATRNYTTTLNALRQFEKDLPEILKSQKAVLDAASVERCWCAIIAPLVKRFRDLPAREASELAHRDEDEIHAKLQTVVESILALIRKDWDELFAEHLESAALGGSEYD
jgi:hypothetical protein